MKKLAKNIFLALGLSTATIYSYNRFIENTATKHNLLDKDNGLFYEKNEKGYVFYSSNNFPLFANQTMDSYTKVKDGIFQISGKIGKYLYYPIEDCLVGPYIDIQPISKGFLIKGINGWGMLDTQLECTIPTQHSKAEILQLLN